MKYLIVLLLFAGETTGFAKEDHATLLLISKEGQRMLYSTKISLEKKGADYLCSTSTIPLHKIKAGLVSSLNPPFPSEKNVSLCDQTLTWSYGKKNHKRCLASDELDPLLDLIRWCTQF